jgi:hypothetical protein
MRSQRVKGPILPCSKAHIVQIRCNNAMKKRFLMYNIEQNIQSTLHLPIIHYRLMRAPARLHICLTAVVDSHPLSVGYIVYTVLSLSLVNSFIRLVTGHFSVSLVYSFKSRYTNQGYYSLTCPKI